MKKSNFYKEKKINDIEEIDVNNILVSKKITKTYLNTLSDTMITMILDHYV